MDKKRIWNNSYNEISGVIKWALFVLAVFWSILIFYVGNVAGGIFSILFMLAICPYTDILLDKLQIKIPRKILLAIRLGLGILAFLISIIFIDTAKQQDVPENTVTEMQVESEHNEPVESDDAESVNAPEEVDEVVSDKDYSGMDFSDKDISDNNGQNNSDRTVFSNLEVHYIDVGQGDCTLLICGGQSMLIDCGPEDSGTKIQLYLRQHNVTKLDYLILTHPDADHIGGADVIITKYNIDNILMLDVAKDTKAYNNVIDAMEYRGMKSRQPEVGECFNLGDALVTVVAPTDFYEEINNMSISVKVELGERSYLFVGDSENDAQYDMAVRDIDINADVYKVAHHGSKSSLNVLFFETVSPEYAVISCGEGNAYGHPHDDTLMLLAMTECKVYRTDLDGTVVSVCDGYEIQWDK